MNPNEECNLHCGLRLDFFCENCKTRLCPKCKSDHEKLASSHIIFNIRDSVALLIPKILNSDKFIESIRDEAKFICEFEEKFLGCVKRMIDLVAVEINEAKKGLSEVAVKESILNLRNKDEYFECYKLCKKIEENMKSGMALGTKMNVLDKANKSLSELNEMMRNFADVSEVLKKAIQEPKTTGLPAPMKTEITDTKTVPKAGYDKSEIYILHAANDEKAAEQLSTVDFSSKKFIYVMCGAAGDATALSLTSVLLENLNLSGFVLRGIGISNAAAELLALPIRKNKNITAFDIFSIMIDDSGFNHIIQAVKENDNIAHLFFASIQVTWKSFISLAQVLRTHSKLRSLSLSLNFDNDFDIHAFEAAINELSEIGNKLKIRFEPFGKENPASLIECIQRNKEKFLLLELGPNSGETFDEEIIGFKISQ